MPVEHANASPTTLAADVQGERVLRRAALSPGSRFTRLLDLFSQGKLYGTVHTCIGQEFTGATLAEHLRETDTMFSRRIDVTVTSSWIGNVDGLVATELMGRSTGICGGRGGSQHLHFARAAFSLPAFKAASRPSGGWTRAGRLARGRRTRRSRDHRRRHARRRSRVRNDELRVALETAAHRRSRRQRLCAVDAQGARRRRRHHRARRGLRHPLVARQHMALGRSLHGVFREAFAHSQRDRHFPSFVLVDTYRLKAHSKGDDLYVRSRNSLTSNRSIRSRSSRARTIRASPPRCGTRRRASDRAVELAVEAAPFPELVHAAPAPARPSWRSAPVRPVRLVQSLNEAISTRRSDGTIARSSSVRILEDPYWRRVQGLAGTLGRIPRTRAQYTDL